jgi:hypothetical protein
LIQELANILLTLTRVVSLIAGRFAPFHIAAVISLATVGAALVPVISRRPKRAWLRLHAELMAWSYVGLVSAFFAEIAVRLPGVDVGAAVSTGIGLFGGALLIYRVVPRVVDRMRASVNARDVLKLPI